MNKLSRADIYLLAEHSNIKEEDIKLLLQKNIYPQKSEWSKFIRLFSSALGIMFFVSGLIFFFAYNWQNLHKFIKIGVIELIITLLTIVVLITKISLNFRNILLFGASVMVGCLFAVFGQIYQTGANAYDFFLGWTIFITLWTVISNFPPLWLFYIVLMNGTFILYTNQVAEDSFYLISLNILICFNALLLLVATYIKNNFNNIPMPMWFSKVLMVWVISLITYANMYTLIESRNLNIGLALQTCILFVLGTYHDFKNKTIYTISLMAISLILIFSTSILTIIEESENLLFLISLFIIASVTATIKYLIHLQKKWAHEN